MLNLSLIDTNKENAQLLVEADEGNIFFTVLHKGEQLDFSFEQKEWNTFKDFVENSFRVNKVKLQV